MMNRIDDTTTSLKSLVEDYVDCIKYVQKDVQIVANSLSWMWIVFVALVMIRLLF